MSMLHATSAPLVFVIPGEPMSKARARVVNGHAYTPERTRVAETAVVAALLNTHPRLQVDGDLTFGVHCQFHMGTRRRRDIDNMLKLILDGLNGRVWADDHQVVEVSARKVQVPKGEACTTVTIVTPKWMLWQPFDPQAARDAAADSAYPDTSRGPRVPEWR